MIGQEKQPRVKEGQPPNLVLQLHSHLVTCCLHHPYPCLPVQEDPGWDRAHLGLQLRGGQRGRQGAALLLRGHRMQRASSLEESLVLNFLNPS